MFQLNSMFSTRNLRPGKSKEKTIWNRKYNNNNKYVFVLCDTKHSIELKNCAPQLAANTTSSVSIPSLSVFEFLESHLKTTHSLGSWRSDDYRISSKSRKHYIGIFHFRNRHFNYAIFKIFHDGLGLTKLSAK